MQDFEIVAPVSGDPYLVISVDGRFQQTFESMLNGAQREALEYWKKVTAKSLVHDPVESSKMTTETKDRLLQSLQKLSVEESDPITYERAISGILIEGVKAAIKSEGLSKEDAEKEELNRYHFLTGGVHDQSGNKPVLRKIDPNYVVKCGSKEVFHSPGTEDTREKITAVRREIRLNFCIYEAYVIIKIKKGTFNENWLYRTWQNGEEYGVAPFGTR